MITAMDENLVGYLLRALDPEAQREVEAYLQAQPDAAKKLELLRQALQPLSADRETPMPPAGLRLRTLARVAEYRCRDLPRTPVAPPIRARSVTRSWWRRADVLVAASLLLIALPLLPPGLTYLRYQRNLLECKNNLRNFYSALMAYSGAHGGALPRVEDTPPRHVAGIVVPILHDAQLLSHEITVGCPAKGWRSPPNISMRELEQKAAVDPASFMEYARNLIGCYAYTLGYRDREGHLHGLRLGPGHSNGYLPVMADRPPFDQDNYFYVPAAKNSPNHDGTGQNVLYLGGHVDFCTSRTVGVDRNDIYLNKNKRPEAGLDSSDSVLGASAFQASLPQRFGD